MPTTKFEPSGEPGCEAMIDIRGLSFVEERIALVIDFQFPDGSQQVMLMDKGFARALGCHLIETASVDQPAEERLKNNPGKLFNPASTVIEYASRLEQRMKLNDSAASFVWSKSLVQ
jgi:hypothetical protein